MKQIVQEILYEALPGSLVVVKGQFRRRCLAWLGGKSLGETAIMQPLGEYLIDLPACSLSARIFLNCIIGLSLILCSKTRTGFQRHAFTID